MADETNQAVLLALGPSCSPPEQRAWTHLGVARAHEHAARPVAQWEDVARAAEVRCVGGGVS